MSDFLKKTVTRRRLVQTTAAGIAIAGLPTAASAAPASRISAPAVLKQDVQKVRALMWSNSPTIDDHFKARQDTFNQLQDGKIEIDLQLLPYDQYWQKIDLAYSASEPYDVYFWDVQAYGHYKNGLLLNLQPMVDAAGLFDPAQYPVDHFDVWKLDGQNYFALPENFQTMALYYNKALFDEAGLTVPDDTWTWDQVIEAGTNLTKRDGDRVSQWGLSLGVMSTWWGLQTRSWATGSAFVDQIVEPAKLQFSDTTNVAVLKWAQDLINTQKIVPNPTQAAQSGDTVSFQSGRVAMNPGGSWDLAGNADLPFEWGMVPLPKVGDNRIVPYWMGGWVIPNASKVQQAAFEWARWSATDYQAQMAAEHDWIPIKNDARSSEAMFQGMPSGFQAVTQALDTAKLGDFYTKNVQQIWNEVFTPNLDKLYNNDQSPEDTAKSIDDAGNALLVQ